MILKAIKTGFLRRLHSFLYPWLLPLSKCFVCRGGERQGRLALREPQRDHRLLEVARDIEKQSGVWFRGDETLFQEKISVTFNDLPLEEGLKRILANLNYSLMFDAKNKVAGVMVMGEGTPAGTQPARPGAQPPRVTTPPRTATRPAPDSENQAFDFHSACGNGASTPEGYPPACSRRDCITAARFSCQRSLHSRMPSKPRRTLRLPAGRCV